MIHSPVITTASCNVLQDLIVIRQQNVKKLCIENNLIPKHDYLLELPVIIKMFGPPVTKPQCLHEVWSNAQNF